MTTMVFDGLTAAQIVAAITTEPGWQWATNPTNGGTHATMQAIESRRYGRTADAEKWDAVAALLRAAAPAESIGW